MDFCEPGSPQDDIGNVAAVLDLLQQTLCWLRPKERPDLRDKSVRGLYISLYAGQRTMEKQAEHN